MLVGFWKMYWKSKDWMLFSITSRMYNFCKVYEPFDFLANFTIPHVSRKKNRIS